MFVEDEITPTPIQSTYANMLREKVEEVLAYAAHRAKPASCACALGWIMAAPTRWRKSARSLG